MKKQELLEQLVRVEFQDVYVPLNKVIEMVRSLDETSEEADEYNDELFEKIANKIDCEGTDIVDDYDLEMSYREVELSSISFDTDKIVEIIRNVIEQSKK